MSGSAGAAEEAGNQPDAVVRQMKDLEVSDSLAHQRREEGQVKDSVKSKALDNSMKTAVQIAPKIIKTENSSLNAEVSNKISDVTNR